MKAKTYESNVANVLDRQRVVINGAGLRKIKRQVEEHPLTTAQMARRVGVSPSHLSNLLNGKGPRGWPKATFKALNELLNNERFETDCIPPRPGESDKPMRKGSEEYKMAPQAVLPGTSPSVVLSIGEAANVIRRRHQKAEHRDGYWSQRGVAQRAGVEEGKVNRWFMGVEWELSQSEKNNILHELGAPFSVGTYRAAGKTTPSESKNLTLDQLFEAIREKVLEKKAMTAEDVPEGVRKQILRAALSSLDI